MKNCMNMYITMKYFGSQSTMFTERSRTGSRTLLLTSSLLLPFPPSSSSPCPDSLASHVTEEEEEEDGEYNFLADCLREEEREEFRNDRAVRIPRNITWSCFYFIMDVYVPSARDYRNLCTYICMKRLIS